MTATKGYAIHEVASLLTIFIAKAIFTLNILLYGGKQMLQIPWYPMQIARLCMFSPFIPSLHPKS